MVESIKYAWREILRRKKRNILNVSGYAIAVVFLLLSLSFSDLFKKGTSELLKYTGAQFIGFILADSTSSQDIFNRSDIEKLSVFNNPTRLFPIQLIDVIRKSGHVREASAVLSFSVQPSENIQKSWTVAGFDPGNMESVRMVNCSATDITEGGLLLPGDSGVVLLEQTFADSYQYKVNDQITLGLFNFHVKGILSPGTRPVKADIYVPYDESLQLLNSRLRTPVREVANVVLVDGASSLTNYSAIRDVKEILGFRSATIGYGCFDPAGAAIGITKKGLQLFGISVFIGMVLFIAFSHYTAVVERTYDIGILKAIGWGNRQIVMQIFAESVIISAIGGITGCLLSLIVTYIVPVEPLLGIPAGVDLVPGSLLLLLGVLTTIFSGILVGTGSVWISVRLLPSQILRKL